MVTCRLTLELLCNVMPPSESFTHLCYIDILAVWVSWKWVHIDNTKCARVRDLEGEFISNNASHCYVLYYNTCVGV